MRELGASLGLPEELVWRQPFPGPGLGVRIVGVEVNKLTCRIVQEADAIFIEEIRRAGLYRKISQAYAALLGVPVVGVAGDMRVHTCPVVLRAVTTSGERKKQTPDHLSSLVGISGGGVVEGNKPLLFSI